jgi:hypothetical protein
MKIHGFCAESLFHQDAILQFLLSCPNRLLVLLFATKPWHRRLKTLIVDHECDYSTRALEIHDSTMSNSSIAASHVTWQPTRFSSALITASQRLSQRLGHSYSQLGGWREREFTDVLVPPPPAPSEIFQTKIQKCWAAKVGLSEVDPFGWQAVSDLSVRPCPWMCSPIIMIYESAAPGTPGLYFHHSDQCLIMAVAFEEIQQMLNH